MLQAITNKKRAIEKAQREANGQASTGQSPNSPVKTVLGALAKKHQKQGKDLLHGKTSPRKKANNEKLVPTVPNTIEDVPFRRQDRRVLNARKKRVMDRKLIRCLMMSGLFIILAGGALFALYWLVFDGMCVSFPYLHFAAVALSSIIGIS